MAQDPNNPDLYASAQAGARFAVHHLERPMSVYPVHESEIEQTSFLNPIVATLFSVASALILLAVGLIADLAIEGQLARDELTELGRAILVIVVPVLVVLGVIAGSFGYLAWRKRKSVWDTIRAESHVATQSTQSIAEPEHSEV